MVELLKNEDSLLDIVCLFWHIDIKYKTYRKLFIFW